jgi:hypothetical protein
MDGMVGGVQGEERRKSQTAMINPLLARQVEMYYLKMK